MADERDGFEIIKGHCDEDSGADWEFAPVRILNNSSVFVKRHTISCGVGRVDLLQVDLGLVVMGR